MPSRVDDVCDRPSRAERSAKLRTTIGLLLALAVAPGLAAADDLRGAGPTGPLRPPTRDYAALLRAPASRNAHNAFSRPALYTAPGVAFPAGSVCRAALVRAEARYAIPSGLLQAIGIVESGRRNEVTGTRQPWPWTTDVEGESRFFDTKAQAVAWVRQAQAHGTRNIDIGCAQVNLMHHPAAFGSLEQAFDPAANADYAARFLVELKTAAGGNWMTAVGYYHSQTPELAASYRQMVQAVTSRGGPAAPYLLPVADSLERQRPNCW